MVEEEELHVPPEVASVRVIVAPVQTVDAPPIAAGAVPEETVMVFVT